jgi:hypothetical protein
MPDIGFSTGALFKDRLADGVDLLRQLKLVAIELSALRLRELPGLIAFVRDNDLSYFKYVSLHAPTDFTPEQERAVASALLAVALKTRWRVVVHPDCISDVDAWKPFGDLLCIENMDKRKCIGRTASELDQVFSVLPLARLCFDIAHARQVDTTMTEAYRVLGRFRDRIVQIHMSEVTSASTHGRISESAVLSYREVAAYLPDVPVILESPVTPDSANAEVEQASRVFAYVLAAS